jgi:hypothetical protein
MLNLVVPPEQVGPVWGRPRLPRCARAAAYGSQRTRLAPRLPALSPNPNLPGPLPSSLSPQVRDTVDLFHFRRHRKLSLRFLASYILGSTIQVSTGMGVVVVIVLEGFLYQAPAGRRPAAARTGLASQTAPRHPPARTAPRAMTAWRTRARRCGCTRPTSRCRWGRGRAGGALWWRTARARAGAERRVVEALLSPLRRVSFRRHGAFPCRRTAPSTTSSRRCTPTAGTMAGSRCRPRAAVVARAAPRAASRRGAAWHAAGAAPAGAAHGDAWQTRPRACGGAQARPRGPGRHVKLGLRACRTDLRIAGRAQGRERA